MKLINEESWIFGSILKCHFSSCYLCIGISKITILITLLNVSSYYHWWFEFSLSKDTLSLKTVELLGVLWMLNTVFLYFPSSFYTEVKQIHPFRETLVMPKMKTSYVM